MAIQPLVPTVHYLLNVFCLKTLFELILIDILIYGGISFTCVKMFFFRNIYHCTLDTM